MHLLEAALLAFPPLTPAMPCFLPRDPPPGTPLQSALLQNAPLQSASVQISRGLGAAPGVGAIAQKYGEPHNLFAAVAAALQARLRTAPWILPENGGVNISSENGGVNISPGGKGVKGRYTPQQARLRPVDLPEVFLPPER